MEVAPEHFVHTRNPLVLSLSLFILMNQLLQEVATLQTSDRKGREGREIGRNEEEEDEKKRLHFSKRCSIVLVLIKCRYSSTGELSSKKVIVSSREREG